MAPAWASASACSAAAWRAEQFSLLGIGTGAGLRRHGQRLFAGQLGSQLFQRSVFCGDAFALGIGQYGSGGSAVAREAGSGFLFRHLGGQRRHGSLFGIILFSQCSGGGAGQRSALVGQGACALVLLFFRVRRRGRGGIGLGTLACLLGGQLFGGEADMHLRRGIFLGGSALHCHFAQALVGADARFGGGQNIRFGGTAGFSAGRGHVFEALAVDGRIAQLLFSIHAQVQRRGRGAFGFGLGQCDGFALLLQMRQRARFFQRLRFGGSAGKGRRQGNLVGALALHGQFEGFGLGLGQHFRGLARTPGLAFALARHDGHARIGTGAVQHFFARGVDGGNALGSLQAGLFSFRHQIVGGAGSLDGQFGVGFSQFGRALAGLFFQPAARFSRQANVRVGFDAGAQIGGFLAHGVEALGTGHRRRAQGFEPIAIRFDGVFRRLGTGQGSGCGLGIHRGPFLGHGARAGFGVGAVFGGERCLGFRLDARNRFLDCVHVHRPARCRQADGYIGVVVWWQYRFHRVLSAKCGVVKTSLVHYRATVN